MTKRNINIDLLRIIATIFVILLHVLGKGGVLYKTVPFETNYWSAWFLEVTAYCAVNIFVLISGYVMIDKTIKLKNIINLWIHVLFYSLSITALFFIFVPDTRSLEQLAISFIPITGKQWWYMSSYFLLLCFIPILNTFINNIPRKTYKKILIVFLLGICIFDRVTTTDAFMLNNGYSPLWLIIVYLFGAYIKKYDLKDKISAQKCLFGFIVMIILTLISVIFIPLVTKHIFGQVENGNMFLSYTSITVLFAAIFLFLFFLNIKIRKFFIKVISLFSAATLGVYLIHSHPLVINFVIKDAYIAITNMHTAILILFTITITLVIFLLCTIIELLRIQLFKLFQINKLSELIDNKIVSIYTKVFKE